MLKRTLMKSVLGTLLAAGAFAVPGALAGGTQIQLVACTYPSSKVTTTTLTVPALFTAGDATNRSVTVTGPGTLPTAALTVTATPYGSASAPYAGAPIELLNTTAGGSSAVSRTFSTSGLAGNTTYRIVASYAGGCEHTSSTDTKHSTVYKLNTKTVLSKSGSTYTATVTEASNRDLANSSAPVAISGSVRFTRNSGATVDVAISGGSASYNPPNGNVTSAQYLGDPNYNTSTSSP